MDASFAAALLGCIAFTGAATFFVFAGAMLVRAGLSVMDWAAALLGVFVGTMGAGIGFVSYALWGSL